MLIRIIFVELSSGWHPQREIQAFRQTIGAFVCHDLRKSNDVVIILVQGRWSHRPPLMYPETKQ